MSTGTPQPLVLIGARSEARGRQLEHLLTENGRVAILGVHTLTDPLLRALTTSPTAALVLDNQLADGASIALLFRVMMRRPCATIALASEGTGDFVLQAVRAGAAECVNWDGTPESAENVALALETAVGSLGEPLQVCQTRTVSTAKAQFRRVPTDALIVIVGSRRAAALCDAIEYLPGSFPGAVLCRKPVHASTLRSFVGHLDARSQMRVVLAKNEEVYRGRAYLFGGAVQLRAHVDSAQQTRLQLKYQGEVDPRQASAPELDTILSSRKLGGLECVVVTHGDIDDTIVTYLAPLVEAGVALARAVPGGYQIRWSKSGAHTLPSETFWQHVHVELSTRLTSGDA